MKRRRLIVALSLLLAGRAAAYTLLLEPLDGGQLVHLHWPANAQPIPVKINNQTAPTLANVMPGSDPLAAVERALSRWPAACAITLQESSTSVADANGDGVNVITFADTTVNRQIFEMAGGALGLTLTYFIDDRITEADILFNPTVAFTTTLDTDDALSQQGLQDIEAVATHELGHFVGLHHTGVMSATMWPLASVLQRSLDADDRAGAQVLYPTGAPAGTIHGTVTVDGQPAFGAQIVAINAAGVVAASALTLQDGTYAIGGLPPNTYTAYVEPLDGPMASVPDGCIGAGNLFGAGIYDGATVTTDFPTTFFGGNAQPAAVVLAASATPTVNFNLASGTNATNPARIGLTTVDDHGGIRVSAATRALAINAGADQFIAVWGTSLAPVPISGISIVGPGAAVGDTVRILTSSCNGPVDYAAFHVTMAADAAAGGRTILFSNGDQISALTGGLDVQAAPSACVGDCDGQHAVTVDDLRTMIDIALGASDVAVCSAGGSDTITVADMVTATNNALGSCP